MNEQNLLQPEEKAFQTFYKRSLLWIAWRPRLKRIGIAVLLIFDIALGAKVIVSFLDYGVINFFPERAMIGSIVADLNRFHAISKENAASTLKASDVQIFNLGDGRADFYAALTNPNDDWEATFRYAFSYADTATEPVASFILPGEKDKPLLALAESVGSLPREATLVVTDLVWTRVNHHAIEDYHSWAAERLNFAVTEVNYDAAVPFGTTTIGRTDLRIKNQSPFSYWEPTFAVLLYRNDKVVGATTVTIPKWTSGEERAVTVNWFQNAPAANRTLVIPLIDIFDPAVYMPLQGEEEPDVRVRFQKAR